MRKWPRRFPGWFGSLVRSGCPRTSTSVVLVLVLGLVWFLLSPVAPASALAGVPAPVTSPAGVIAGIIGDVLPDSGAAQAAGMTLDNGSNGALNILPKINANYDCTLPGNIAAGNCNIDDLKTVAKELPGFQLGFKIGGYIDQATGLLGGTHIPASGFAPYSDGTVVTGDPGWVDGDILTDVKHGAYTLAAQAPVPNSGDATAVYFTLTVNTVPDGGYPDGYDEGSFTAYRVDGSACSSGGFNTYNNTRFYAQCIGPNGAIAPDEVTFTGNAQSSGIRYYLPASPSRPAAQSATPDRHWLTTATCQAKNGPVISITGISPAFKETASEWPQYPIAQCPDGTVPVASKVDLTGPDPTTAPLKRLSTVTAPKQWTDWLTANPDCWNGGCPVLLEQHMPDGSWRSCFANEAGCADWFTDPNKTSDFRCTQNGNVLALSDCNFYSPSFDPVQRAKGIVYANPKDGVAAVPSQAPVDNPVKTNPAPVPDPSTGTDPGSASPDSSPCFPSGWSAFNPLEWVLHPLQCAFIPSQSTFTQAQTKLTTAYNKTAIGEWFSAIGAVGSIGVADGGCGGVSMDLPSAVTLGNSTHSHQTIFATCDEPWKTIAFLVKSFLTLMIVWGAGLGVMKQLGDSFGLNIRWGSRGN